MFTSKLKILNILFENIEDPQGGLGVFVRDCFTEIAKDHRVTMLSYDPMTLKFSDKNYRGCRVLNCRSTNIHQKPKGPYHLLTLNDMMVENLLYHLKNEHFDIIHLHDTLLWPIAKYAAILFKAPIITHAHLSHALVHRGYGMHPQMTYEVTQEAHAYMMAHGVMTCSKYYADEINQHFMLDLNWTVATNGVDFDHLQQFKYSKGLNREIGKGKQVVGFVGRMVPSKGIELIMDAIRRIPDKHFLIISNVAPSVERYFPLVKELRRMKGNYKNFTWVSDLPTNSDRKWELMASCDIGLIPSLHEPWAIVTDEWGALKVPKIVTSVGGMPEHNADRNGIMIEPNSCELINAIQKFWLSQYKIKNALFEAKVRNWKNTADKVLKKYDQVLGDFHGIYRN